ASSIILPSTIYTQDLSLHDALPIFPDTIVKHIETTFPGWPASGGSDNASFVAAGAPAFNLSSLSWRYWNYTWHTNLDTYDKIVRSEEHTSELQSRENLVCRLLLENK